MCCQIEKQGIKYRQPRYIFKWLVCCEKLNYSDNSENMKPETVWFLFVCFLVQVVWYDSVQLWEKTKLFTPSESANWLQGDICAFCRHLNKNIDCMLNMVNLLQWLQNWWQMIKLLRFSSRWMTSITKPRALHHKYFTHLVGVKCSQSMKTAIYSLSSFYFIIRNRQGSYVKWGLGFV